VLVALYSYDNKECIRAKHITIGKRHSFVGVFKFIGTDEYIQIIVTGFETDEYNFIFVG
jgi:hypothetical protein